MRQAMRWVGAGMALLGAVLLSSHNGDAALWAAVAGFWALDAALLGRTDQ